MPYDMEKDFREPYRKQCEDYTGFTTKCKKCGVHVRTKRLGKTPEGIASYELVCDCKEKKDVR